MQYEHKITKKLEKVVWLGDQHVPYHDVKSNRAVLKYVKDLKPDVIILGGDVADIFCVSSHNKDKLRQVSGKTLQKEYDAVNRYLDDVQAVGTKKIYYLEGNHEYRVTRYIDANPQMEGAVEIPKCLNLNKRGIIWIPSWSETIALRIGKAAYVHGLYHNQYHCASMVSGFESNIFYGHMHSVESAAKVAVGEHNTKIAQSLGCLCDYRQYYLNGRPTKWQQAFGVFYFRDDGFFNYYVPMIFNHKFVSPEGQLYAA